MTIWSEGDYYNFWKNWDSLHTRQRKALLEKEKDKDEQHLGNFIIKNPKAKKSISYFELQSQKSIHIKFHTAQISANHKIQKFYKNTVHLKIFPSYAKGEQSAGK